LDLINAWNNFIQAGEIGVLEMDAILMSITHLKNTFLLIVGKVPWTSRNGFRPLFWDFYFSRDLSMD